MDVDFLSNYRYKIKTSTELQEILGNFPHQKSVIMCHGVFDVVHPGHLRHLGYAKSKADTLIVSITSDQYIKKGTYRPHVPEDLRALNLAALAMVDFVVIDRSPTPMENIRRIQPEFFAKGFEYFGATLAEATGEELNELSKYGGQFIFTPGDFVLSSSELISERAPDLVLEKLISLMQVYNIKFFDIESAILKMSKLKVHVIGDTIVDTFTKTAMIGGQTKTPTISVRKLATTSFIGGAGIVALHLNATGAKVTFTTLLGNDNSAKKVEGDFLNSGVILNKITETGRPTTEKNVILCDGYRLLKIDNVDNAPISDSLTAQFKRKIQETKSDVVVFSDFRHGIFHKQNIAALIDSIPIESFKAADSQVASRWGNITDFVGFDLVTPNEREARFSTADQDSTIGPLASKIYKATKCKNLLLKLGERGLIGLFSSSDSEDLRLISLDSFANKPVDPVGAGDALMAYAVLILKSSQSLPMAAIVGSLAAACASENNGNVPVTPAEVLSKLEQIRKHTNYSLK